MKAKRKETDHAAPVSYGLEERLGSLFQPDTLIADEYLANYRRKVPLEPEKTLMLAVLEDGVCSFQENIFVQDGKKRILFEESKEWLFSDESDGIFSFSSICMALGLEPGYIRRGLRRWEEQVRAAAQKKSASPDSPPERMVA
jgi:hypothetical protein